MSKMEMRLETIGPQKAAEWLKYNKSNRKLTSGHVNRLAAAIEAGEWRVNGDTIKFNGQDLVDGQHRLNAVIRSGMSIQCYVVRGISADAYDTLDQGKNRSLADALSRCNVLNYTFVAGACRWLFALRNETSGRQSHKTLVFMHKFFNDNAEALDASCHLIKSFTQVRDGWRGPGALAAALHVVFAELDRTAADDFWTKVCIGENLTRAMPEYKLREIFKSQLATLRKLPIDIICILCIKAWNCRRTGKEMKQLKCSSDESRPKIL